MVSESERGLEISRLKDWLRDVRKENKRIRYRHGPETPGLVVRLPKGRIGEIQRQRTLSSASRPMLKGTSAYDGPPLTHRAPLRLVPQRLLTTDIPVWFNVRPHPSTVVMQTVGLQKRICLRCTKVFTAAKQSLEKYCPGHR